MTRPVLRVTGLEVRREGVEILRGVDWQVDPGQHWVLMGANGSGKTSLLHTLTAYLPATRGTIELLGHRYGRTDWRELRKQVGIVSMAIPSLMPADEPGLRVVASGAEARIGSMGPPAEEALTRARELLEEIRCGHLEHRPWRVLSQGERQRLLIGRALHADPALLILDEPCAGLDPVAREHFLHFLEELGARGTPTLVLVTHHVEEIVPVFSHVALLRDGALLASGPRDELLDSELMGKTFGADVTLVRRGNRYGLEVPSGEGVI